MSSAVGEPGTRWRGVSAPDRRAARRELLLDAGFDLLGVEGWSGTSVRRVCGVARLNPRYFYESFEDLDALLLAVFDRLVVEITRGVLSAVAGAGDDPRAKTRAAVECVVRYVADDPRRAKVLFVEAIGNERLMQRRLDTMHEAARFVELAGRHIYGEPPEGERIGTIAANLLVGGGTELLVAWLLGRLDVTQDQLIEDTAALLFLAGEGAAAIAGGRGDRRPAAG
jgi:AcrR family transcriptional regulator